MPETPRTPEGRMRQPRPTVLAAGFGFALLLAGASPGAALRLVVRRGDPP
jgi:hypothetical protein